VPFAMDPGRLLTIPLKGVLEKTVRAASDGGVWSRMEYSRLNASVGVGSASSRA